jgi:hypothetical protein
MLTREAIEQKINEASGKIRVTLTNGITIFLIGFDTNKNCFVGTFLPCATNAQKYDIVLEKIEEIEKN